MTIDLPLIWAGIIAFAVFMYVLMDGFDLGVGILFPFVRDEADRDIMMNSVAPVWDGNETWLVLGGGGLMVAFPLAYATILPALYLPVLLMLIALIFRGVAFEFRFKAEGRQRQYWSWSFHLGSVFAAFAQGIILGAFIQGFAVEGRDFVGGPLDWVSPFAILTGFGLIAGYALLGTTWLVMKTEGGLQAWSFRNAKRALVTVLGFIAIVSVWTPFMDPDIAARWFSWPNIAFVSPVPVITGLVALGAFVALRRRYEGYPFIGAIALFGLSYAGIAISLWPNVVPPDITIWEAASAPKTQAFMLYGVLAVTPFVLAYTAFSYWVFRGKVRSDVGYH
ncbi:MAG: cytochrome d ubiquinol oxidase subunit II [Rhodospirillales bacterium]|nr:MAG: cytochrome d ubiquinol oxidase subunit II [Rhodospirillales bacterium]